jgi:hypothetical protein
VEPRVYSLTRYRVAVESAPTGPGRPADETETLSVSDSEHALGQPSQPLGNGRLSYVQHNFQDRDKLSTH